LSNPYVWAGTDNYTGGKWVRDGANGYDPQTNDAQIGVMALLDAVGAVDGMTLDAATAPSAEQAWSKQVYSGRGIPEGTTGPQVTALQEKLLAAGHYSGKPTGTFDAATKAAVAAWQKAQGLGGKGTFDAASVRAMEAPRLWAELEAGEIQVKQGGGGLHARLAQEKLATLGYLSGAGDGSFGSRSAGALKKFQAASGLDATGVLDAATAKALRGAVPKKRKGVAR
jgi:peptidoglycan hydrolase-like protein with peptidoglycan-binding domain